MLERDWTTYRDRGVVFLGVDYHDLNSDARHFVSVHGADVPDARRRLGQRDHGRYGITQVPETYVLNRQGRVVAHLAGPITDPGFADRLPAARSRRRRRDPAARRSRWRPRSSFAAPAAAACAHPRTSLNVPPGAGRCARPATRRSPCPTRRRRSGSESSSRSGSPRAGRRSRSSRRSSRTTARGFSRRRRTRASTCSRGGCRSWACSPEAIVLAFGVWRWSRRKEPEEPDEPADSGLDEETERRLDDLLARFD